MSDDIDDILAGLTNAPKAKVIPTATPGYDKPIMLPFKDFSANWRGAGASLDEEIFTEDLKGVSFKRLPLPIPDFENYRNIPSYSYHCGNTRAVEVKIIIQFNPSNVLVVPGATAVLAAPRVVEIYLKPGETAHACNVEPQDKRARTFDPFNADVTIFPSHAEVKEEELQGVFLTTRISYGEVCTVEFEAFSEKEYEVIVEVSPRGEILSQTAVLPFRANVKTGQRVRVGTVTCKKDIQSQWRWEQPPRPVYQTSMEKQISKSEAKGVFLTQIQTPGEMNELELELDNTLGTNIVATIEVKGSARIDFQGHENPLNVLVRARTRTTAAKIYFKGEIGLAWGWREEAS